MSAVNGGKRHQRQRSSVTLKKRTSLNKLTDDIATLDVPDNSLSPSNRTTELASASESNHTEHSSLSSPRPSTSLHGTPTTRTHSRGPSFNPTYGFYANPSETDEDLDAVEKKQESVIIADEDYFNRPSTTHSGTLDANRQHDNVAKVDYDSYSHDRPNNEMEIADMTSRTELDLFEEEASSGNATNLVEDGMSDRINDAETDAPPLLPARDKSGINQGQKPGETPAQPPTIATTPTQWHMDEASISATPSSSTRGQKRLSLLVGGSNGLPSSPSTSPRALRTPISQTSNTLSSGNVTPRSARRAKRMSLGYFGSSDPSKAVQSPTISSVHQPMTPPISSSSTSSSFGLRNASVGERSASISTVASVDSRGKLPTDDGETMLTQHKGVLERIAEKERRILELKEHLAREEADLKALQHEWQNTVARELSLGKGRLVPGASSSGGAALSGGVSSPATNRSVENTQDPRSSGGSATEALKGLSAKFQSGFGTQLNAFLDQLVSIPPADEVRAGDEDKDLRESAVDRTGQRVSLSSLKEEDEGDVDGGKKRNTKDTSASLPTVSSSAPSRQSTSSQSQATPKQQAKQRSSMFGASFAALQKQMEQQLGVSTSSSSQEKDKTTDKNGQATVTSAEAPGSPQQGGIDALSGWGAWQKRLKEARENASGFIAMAEAKIGQAMTIDDLMDAGEGPPRRPMPPSAFATENDREKAALAELNWLNSLAGIKTIGNVDRVITSASPLLDDRSGYDENLPSSARLDRQNLLRLNDAEKMPRATSPASSSHSTTRAGELTQSHPFEELRKTRHSAEKAVQDTSSSKRRSTGLFDVLSSVWSPTPDKDSSASATRSLSPTMIKDRRLSGGQNRTRLAARAAMEQGSASDVQTNAEPVAGIGIVHLDERDGTGGIAKGASEKNAGPVASLSDEAQQDHSPSRASSGSVGRHTKTDSENWAW